MVTTTSQSLHFSNFDSWFIVSLVIFLIVFITLLVLGFVLGSSPAAVAADDVGEVLVGLALHLPQLLDEVPEPGLATHPDLDTLDLASAGPGLADAHTEGHRVSHDRAISVI